MLTPEVDIAVNEYCAREILKCIENNTEVPSDVLHTYIKSSAEIITNGSQVGPDSAELGEVLDAIYAYALPIEQHSKSEEKQFNFAAGAVYGALKFLKCYKEE